MVLCCAVFDKAPRQDDSAPTTFPGNGEDCVFFKLDFLGCQEVAVSCDLLLQQTTLVVGDGDGEGDLAAGGHGRGAGLGLDLGGLGRRDPQAKAQEQGQQASQRRFKTDSHGLDFFPYRKN